MRETLKLILISLWLFVSFPLNFATLRHLVRDAFFYLAHLNARLTDHLLLQYLLATIFVVWVMVVLLRGYKLGRTLAIVLLLGSCCEIVALLLIDLVHVFETPPGWPNPIGMVIVCATLLLNIVCLFALRQRA
jgi:hypothetical protein